MSTADISEPASKRNKLSHNVENVGETSVAVAAAFQCGSYSGVAASSSSNTVDALDSGSHSLSTADDNATSPSSCDPGHSACQMKPAPPFPGSSEADKTPAVTNVVQEPTNEPLPLPAAQAHPSVGETSEPAGKHIPDSEAASQDITKTASSSKPCVSSNEIEESLLCIICQEILYNCVRSVCVVRRVVVIVYKIFARS